MTLDKLKADVLKYFHHDKVSSEFDTILRNAESELRPLVQSSKIELSVYGDVELPYIELPDDVSVIQRLIIYKGKREVSQPQLAAGANESLSGCPGVPLTFNVLDQVLMLYPEPNELYEYALYYIPEIRPLDVSNPTNSILEQSPTVYLYACLHQAALMLEDMERAAMYDSKFRQAVQTINGAALRMKYPINTPLVMKTRSSV